MIVNDATSTSNLTSQPCICLFILPSTVCSAIFYLIFLLHKLLIYLDINVDGHCLYPLNIGKEIKNDWQAIIFIALRFSLNVDAAAKLLFPLCIIFSYLRMSHLLAGKA